MRPNFLPLGIIVFFNVLCVSSDDKSLRDPFNLPSRVTTRKTKFDIRLLGIIRCKDKFGAVLQVKDATETVFINDIFKGFKVLDIKSDSIILSKGKIKKEIFIE